jgi:hypothetical protein
MNGQGRPKNAIEAMLAAQQHGAPAPGQQRIDPIQFFGQFFGLSVPALSAMQPNMVPCMCGRCQGLGIQLEVRMHFPIVGPPELITRGDAVKAQEQAPAAKPE